jgi:hypothetical protein
MHVCGTEGVLGAYTVTGAVVEEEDELGLRVVLGDLGDRAIQLASEVQTVPVSASSVSNLGARS